MQGNTINRADVAVDTLNGLLRGEISAVETYDQAMAKFEGAPEAKDLERLRGAHLQAVATLREQVALRGGTPADSSGAWGWWAKAVEGTAQIFGKTAALKALKEGEEHGVRDYGEALEDENLDDALRVLITSTLLPKTRGHVPMLDRLMEVV